MWNPEGVAICTNSAVYYGTKICSDGEGGAIIVWYDYSTGIYAQRINASGDLQWNVSGKFISSASYCRQVCSDNLGGAVFTWIDSNDLYAQHINSNGIVTWNANGVVICNATSRQDEIQFFCDIDGTSFFTWTDFRKSGTSPILEDPDIYAQKIDIDGNVVWQLNGTPICTLNESQWLPQICSDGMSGAIINWVDVGRNQCFAQRINSTGVGQWGSNGTVLVSSINWIGYQTMISDDEGGAIIAIRGFLSGLYALRINSSADMIFFEHIYLTDIMNSVGAVKMCLDGEGGTFITWTKLIPPADVGAYTYDILAQRIDANGTVFWSKSGKVICNAPGDQLPSRICNNGVGKAIITWEDNYPDYLHPRDIDIYFTILDLIEDNNSVPIGNSFLLFTVLAILGLIMISRHRLN